MKLNKYLIISIFAIGIFFIFQRGSKNGFGFFEPAKIDTVVKVDTLIQLHDTVITKKMVVKQVIHDTLPPEYLPDPMFDSLKVQYMELVEEYLAKNIYYDTVKLDTFGHVLVYDTVKNNKLQGRSYSSNYKIPVIRDSVFVTEIKEAPPKREIYFGGGYASSKSLQHTGHIGILYKSKTDKITGLYVAVLPGMKIGYGVQTYWKLNFKK